MRLINVFCIWILGFGYAYSEDGIDCNSKGFICYSRYEFYQCVDIGDKTITQGEPQYCPPGFVCNDLLEIECEDEWIVDTTLSTIIPINSSNTEIDEVSPDISTNDTTATTVTLNVTEDIIETTTYQSVNYSEVTEVPVITEIVEGTIGTIESGQSVNITVTTDISVQTTTSYESTNYNETTEVPFITTAPNQSEVIENQANSTNTSEITKGTTTLDQSQTVVDMTDSSVEIITSYHPTNASKITAEPIQSTTADQSTTIKVAVETTTSYELVNVTAINENLIETTAIAESADDNEAIEEQVESTTSAQSINPSEITEASVDATTSNQSSYNTAIEVTEDHVVVTIPAESTNIDEYIDNRDLEGLEKTTTLGELVTVTEDVVQATILSELINGVVTEDPAETTAKSTEEMDSPVSITTSDQFQNMTEVAKAPVESTISDQSTKTELLDQSTHTPAIAEIVDAVTVPSQLPNAAEMTELHIETITSDQPTNTNEVISIVTISPTLSTNLSEGLDVSAETIPSDQSGNVADVTVNATEALDAITISTAAGQWTDINEITEASVETSTLDQSTNVTEKVVVETTSPGYSTSVDIGIVQVGTTSTIEITEASVVDTTSNQSTYNTASEVNEDQVVVTIPAESANTDESADNHDLEGSEKTTTAGELVNVTEGVVETTTSSQFINGGDVSQNPVESITSAQAPNNLTNEPVATTMVDQSVDTTEVEVIEHLADGITTQFVNINEATEKPLDTNDLIGTITSDKVPTPGQPTNGSELTQGSTEGTALLQSTSTKDITEGPLEAITTSKSTDTSELAEGVVEITVSTESTNDSEATEGLGEGNLNEVIEAANTDEGAQRPFEVTTKSPSTNTTDLTENADEAITSGQLINKTEVEEVEVDVNTVSQLTNLNEVTEGLKGTISTHSTDVDVVSEVPVESTATSQSTNASELSEVVFEISTSTNDREVTEDFIEGTTLVQPNNVTEDPLETTARNQSNEFEDGVETTTSSHFVNKTDVAENQFINIIEVSENPVESTTLTENTNSIPLEIITSESVDINELSDVHETTGSGQSGNTTDISEDMRENAASNQSVIEITTPIQSISINTSENSSKPEGLFETTSSVLIANVTEDFGEATTHSSSQSANPSEAIEDLAETTTSPQSTYLNEVTNEPVEDQSTDINKLVEGTLETTTSDHLVNTGDAAEGGILIETILEGLSETTTSNLNINPSEVTEGSVEIAASNQSTFNTEVTDAPVEITTPTQLIHASEVTEGQLEGTTLAPFENTHESTDRSELEGPLETVVSSQSIDVAEVTEDPLERSTVAQPTFSNDVIDETTTSEQFGDANQASEQSVDVTDVLKDVEGATLTQSINVTASNQSAIVTDIIEDVVDNTDQSTYSNEFVEGSVETTTSSKLVNAINVTDSHSINANEVVEGLIESTTLPQFIDVTEFTEELIEATLASQSTDTSEYTEGTVNSTISIQPTNVSEIAETLADGITPVESENVDEITEGLVKTSTENQSTDANELAESIVETATSDQSVNTIDVVEGVLESNISVTEESVRTTISSQPAEISEEDIVETATSIQLTNVSEVIEAQIDDSASVESKNEEVVETTTLSQSANRTHGVEDLVEITTLSESTNVSEIFETDVNEAKELSVEASTVSEPLSTDEGTTLVQSVNATEVTEDSLKDNVETTTPGHSVNTTNVAKDADEGALSSQPTNAVEETAGPIEGTTLVQDTNTKKVAEESIETTTENLSSDMSERVENIEEVTSSGQLVNTGDIADDITLGPVEGTTSIKFIDETTQAQVKTTTASQSDDTSEFIQGNVETTASSESVNTSYIAEGAKVDISESPVETTTLFQPTNINEFTESPTGGTTISQSVDTGDLQDVIETTSSGHSKNKTDFTEAAVEDTTSNQPTNSGDVIEGSVGDTSSDQSTNGEEIIEGSNETITLETTLPPSTILNEGIEGLAGSTLVDQSTNIVVAEGSAEITNISQSGNTESQVEVEGVFVQDGILEGSISSTEAPDEITTLHQPTDVNEVPLETTTSNKLVTVETITAKSTEEMESPVNVTASPQFQNITEVTEAPVESTISDQSTKTTEVLDESTNTPTIAETLAATMVPSQLPNATEITEVHTETITSGESTNTNEVISIESVSSTVSTNLGEGLDVSAETILSDQSVNVTEFTVNATEALDVITISAASGQWTDINEITEASVETSTLDQSTNVTEKVVVETITPGYSTSVDIGVVQVGTTSLTEITEASFDDTTSNQSTYNTASEVTEDQVVVTIPAKSANTDESTDNHDLEGLEKTTSSGELVNVTEGVVGTTVSSQFVNGGDVTEDPVESITTAQAPDNVTNEPVTTSMVDQSVDITEVEVIEHLADGITTQLVNINEATEEPLDTNELIGTITSDKVPTPGQPINGSELTQGPSEGTTLLQPASTKDITEGPLEAITTSKSTDTSELAEGVVEITISTESTNDSEATEGLSEGNLNEAIEAIITDEVAQRPLEATTKSPPTNITDLDVLDAITIPTASGQWSDINEITAASVETSTLDQSTNVTEKVVVETTTPVYSTTIDIEIVQVETTPSTLSTSVSEELKISAETIISEIHNETTKSDQPTNPTEKVIVETTIPGYSTNAGIGEGLEVLTESNIPGQPKNVTESTTLSPPIDASKLTEAQNETSISNQSVDTASTEGYIEIKEDNASTISPLREFVCTSAGKFSDINDCSLFHLCINAFIKYIDIPIRCPDGTQFNSDTKKCTRRPVQCPGDPPLRCVTAGVFPHPADDTRYYKCYWTSLHKQFAIWQFNCPISAKYDKNLKRCVQYEAPNDAKPFHCVESGKFPVDYSCDEYYECKLKNGFYEVKLKSCSSGKLFDAEWQRCKKSRLVLCPYDYYEELSSSEEDSEGGRIKKPIRF